MASDLAKLGRLFYGLEGITGDVSETTLESNLTVLQKEMGLTEAYESVIDHPYQEYINDQTRDNSKPFENWTDTAIEEFAEVVLRQYGLLPERLVNIVNEIKAQRIFSEQGNTKEYILLPNMDHYNSITTLYAEPSTFIIKSRITGIESLPSRDVEKLMSEFGAIKK